MSTGRTSTINQALGIALIVFVMLTFILTVTTYLFFGQKFQAEEQAGKDRDELAVAEQKAIDADEKYKSVVLFVGVENAEKSIDEMRQEFADLFPDYKEQDAASLKLVDLAKWLDKARIDTDGELKAAQASQAAAEAARLKAEADLKAASDAFAEKLKKEEDDRKEVEAQAEKRRTEFEQELKNAVDEKEQVLKRVESMRLLVDEIAKGESRVGKAAYEGKDPVARVSLLLKAISDRDKTIQLLERSELLGAVAAADPQVQTYVLDALGATAQEIESLKPMVRRVAKQPADAGAIDGRIVAVDQREKAVTIACDSTFGIRPGLIFNVHPGTLPAGSVRSVKAVVEVVEVDGRSLVRGRIRRDVLDDPILPGDTVSTPLWSVGKPLEAVVVGFVDFDGDGKEDLKPLEDTIRRSGGSIARSVSGATSVLVDAGKPIVRGDEAGGNRVAFKAVDEKRRNVELAEARRLGVRVLTLDAFLEWLGAERPVMTQGAVAVPGPERVPPVRPVSANGP